MVWEIRGRVRYHQQGGLGWGKGDRTRNRRVLQTDGRTMLRECQGEGKKWIGRRRGVLRANWNGVVRVLGHNSHVQGGRYFQTRDRRGVKGSGNIRLATLNIRSGRAGGLELALRALRQGNIDVGVLQETKLTDRIHV